MPNATALILGQQSPTYDEVNRRADLFVQSVKRGTKRAICDLWPRTGRRWGGMVFYPEDYNQRLRCIEKLIFQEI